MALWSASDLPRNQLNGGNDGREPESAPFEREIFDRCLVTFGSSKPRSRLKCAEGHERGSMSEQRVTIERTVFIDASPETVFGFLVDPALMAEWIGSSATLEPRVGGLLRIEFNRGDVASGQYEEVVPNRRVVFTWGWEPGHRGQNPNLTLLPPGASLVEIDLEPKDGGTLLRLRHRHVPPEIAQPHGERWSHYLAKLGAVARAREEKPETTSGLT